MPHADSIGVMIENLAIGNRKSAMSFNDLGPDLIRFYCAERSCFLTTVIFTSDGYCARVMHCISRNHTFRLVPVSSAGVHVAIKTREVAARDLDPNAMSRFKVITRRHWLTM